MSRVSPSKRPSDGLPWSNPVKKRRSTGIPQSIDLRDNSVIERPTTCCLPQEQRHVLILPPNPHQQKINQMDIPFSVQWELERLIARQSDISWAEFEQQDLDMLKGTSFDVMPKIENTMADVRMRTTGTQINGPGRVISAETTIVRRKRMLTEMDMEEESIRRGDLPGVGTDNPRWSHGGKICYSVVVRPANARNNHCVSLSETSAFPRKGYPVKILEQPVPDKLNFTMDLCPPEMPGKSFRLARRFGSRRILSFKLKDFTSSKQKSDLISLFTGRILVLFGRTYRALWAPPDKDSVFAIETNDSNQQLSEAPMPAFQEILESESILGFSSH